MSPPKVVGSKVNKDGTFLSYPGNTTICDLSECPQALRNAIKIRERLQVMPHADRFAFLPIDSLHMTVFELLCDQVRDDDHWTQYIPKNVKIRDTDAFFCNCFAFIYRPEHLAMRVTSLYCNDILIIKLIPHDKYTDDAVWRYRNDLSKMCGVRFNDHDTYEFHITLAYKFRPLSEQERDSLVAYLDGVLDEQKYLNKVLTLKGPRLVKFDDMTKFEPICQTSHNR